MFPHSFHQEAHVSHLTSTNIHRKVGVSPVLETTAGNAGLSGPHGCTPCKARGGGGRVEASDPVHGHRRALSTPGPPPCLSTFPNQEDHLISQSKPPFSWHHRKLTVFSGISKQTLKSPFLKNPTYLYPTPTPPHAELETYIKETLLCSRECSKVIIDGLTKNSR